MDKQEKTNDLAPPSPGETDAAAYQGPEELQSLRNWLVS